MRRLYLVLGLVTVVLVVLASCAPAPAASPTTAPAAKPAATSAPAVTAAPQAVPTAAAAAPTAVKAAPAPAGQKITWTLFSYSWPGGGQTRWDIFADYADTITKKTNGQIEFKLQSANNMPYKGAESLRLVRDGVVDGVQIYGGETAGDAPTLGIPELPLLGKESEYDKAVAEWLRVQKATETLWNQELAKFGGTRLGYNHFGPQALWTNKKVTKVDDMKGLRIRASGPEYAEALRRMGAEPSTIVSAEVYEALGRGLLDGYNTAPENPIPTKWAENTKFGWIVNASIVGDYMIINTNKLNTLSPDLRKAVDEAVADWQQRSVARVKSDLMKALNTDLPKIMTLTYVTPEERTRMRELIRPMWQDLATKAGPAGEQLLQITKKEIGE